MRSVRRIPLILAAVLLLAGCSSTSDVEYLPPIVPEAPGVKDPEGVVPTQPNGFIADPESKRFHRIDCPQTSSVKPSIRQFYVTPFEALNEGFAPCDYCEPMSGWK